MTNLIKIVPMVLGMCIGLLGQISAAQSAELIMFRAEGCPWCKAWDRDVGVVYDKTEEARQMPIRFVDIHETRPADLQNVRSVIYTPTFVLVEDGREIGRVTGYIGEDQFWGLLNGLRRKIASAGK